MSLAAFIGTQREQHGIPYATSCRALGVSQAWFYKWRHGDVSLRRKRRAAVDAAVAYEFARRSGRDGSPMITTRLRTRGGGSARTRSRTPCAARGWWPGHAGSGTTG